jgi:uncharacterized protein (DUF433 family)
MAILAIEHIVSTSDTCAGKPRIDGTRMRVQDVVYYYQAGWDTAKISEQFYLTQGQVHAALSYYYDHKDAIEADLRADEEFARQVEGQYQEQKRQIESRKPQN